jgi:hypothetical protein
MEPVRLLRSKVVGSSPSSGASFEFRADNDGTVVMMLSLSIGRGSRTFRSNLPPGSPGPEPARRLNRIFMSRANP